MTFSYEFTKDVANCGKLHSELEAYEITGVSYFPNIVIVYKDVEVTQQELNEIEQIIANHIPDDPKQTVINVIRNAIQFGERVLEEFAAENVLMGITQEGKTKDVADYLADVMRYIQSGSLYEVINEVNRLITKGLPVDLEPYITENRLNAFKQKIENYLGL